MKKNILILATGGTIACSDNGNGLVPNFSVDELLSYVPNVRAYCNVSGSMIMNIDSSNMRPENWVTIAQSIYDNYDAYDGFVITHGTDTLAYTSSALTYMLMQLNKPVIVTGSQYPIEQTNTDAIQNLNDAIYFACEDLAGVYVVFDGKLISGPRAMKVKTRSYDAFESVNFSTIGEIQHNKVQYKRFVIDNFRPNDSRLESNTLELNKQIDNSVMILKLSPGLDPSIFDYIKKHYRGVIIESFGIGGIPYLDFDVSSAISDMVQDGVSVVMTTQCLEEGVDFGVYEVGRRLPKDKIIFANDMIAEAILAKLMCALGRYDNPVDIKNMLESPVQFDIQDI